MKLNNLQRYVSLNVLSLFGYFVLLILLYIRLVITPADLADIGGYHYDYDMVGYASSMIFSLFLLVSNIILVFFLLAVFIEFIVRYCDKYYFSLPDKIPNRFKPLYNVLFRFGLIFVLMPGFYIFIMLFLPALYRYLP